MQGATNETVRGGYSQLRKSLGNFMVSTAQCNKRTQSLVHSCFIRILRFCFTARCCLAQRVRSVSVGHTCGYMEVQGVQ